MVGRVTSGSKNTVPAYVISIIIGVKIHGNGVRLSLQNRRLPMAWEVHFFSTHLVFYIYPTERRVLFNFLLAKGAGRSFKAHSSAEPHLSYCYRRQADCTGGDGDLRRWGS
jgi:hypothetical protein